MVTVPGAAGRPNAETKGAHTRRAVLEAAISRFGRDGFRATSVADIARDAGVGGTVPYAYFPNKENLFLAAADEDAAGLIGRVVPAALDHPIPDWPLRVVTEVLAALGEHPLAHRILAGLEPDVTVRVLDVPALAELRKGCAEQLLAGQAAGQVRPDIDPAVTANGVVTIMLSLLMSVVQIGVEAAALYGEDIAMVLRKAIEPPAVPGASTASAARRRRGRRLG
jgi:AcrR family transcriptional regulator